jgi:hypothetical protein
MHEEPNVLNYVPPGAGRDQSPSGYDVRTGAMVRWYVAYQVRATAGWL